MGVIVNGFDFDQFGISHNKYLDYVRSNPDFLISTPEESYNYGQNYVDEYFGALSDISYAEFLEQRDTLVDYDVFTASYPSRRLMAAKKMTQSFAVFYDTFAAACRKVISDSLSPMQYDTLINAIEKWVLGNHNISYDTTTGISNEGAAMLEMCAIARYSYDYWYNNIEEWPAGRELTTMSGPGKWFRRIVSAIKRTVADVGGYLDVIDYCNGHNIYGGLCWDHGLAWQSAITESNKSGSTQ